MKKKKKRERERKAIKKERWKNETRSAGEEKIEMMMDRVI